MKDVVWVSTKELDPLLKEKLLNSYPDLGSFTWIEHDSNHIADLTIQSLLPHYDVIAGEFTPYTTMILLATFGKAQILVPEMSHPSNDDIKWFKYSTIEFDRRLLSPEDLYIKPMGKDK